MKAWLSAPAPGQDAPLPKADPESAKFAALTLRKRAAEAEHLESRLAREAGRLIARVPIEKNVFGYLTALNLRLLCDVPLRLAGSVPSAVRAGAGSERIRAMIEDGISAELSRAKQQVIAGLDASRAGDNPPPVSDPVKRAETYTPPPVIDAIRSRLEHEAGPLLVERVLKDVARAKANGAKAFDDALAELMPIQAESTRMVVMMLLAHVDEAVRALRAKETDDHYE